MNTAMRNGRSDPVAVLDVGGSKIACFVANITDTAQPEILGVGHQLSRGIRGGVVTDVEEAQTSIVAAIHAAEEMAGVTIDEVMVSVTLPDLHSRHVRVELALGSEPISDRDLADIIREGEANIADNEYLLHSMPIGFTLDNNRGIRDPRGMVGDSLTADLLLVTAPSNLLRNLGHCIARCHLEVSHYVAAPYAAALACLEEDEKELGATLVDLGGSITGYAAFSAGKLVYLGNIPLGAAHLTHDIAVGLSTGLQEAERLKTMYGSAIISPADDEVMIEVPQLGNSEFDEGETVPRSSLIHIMRPRLEEIFEMVRQEMEASGIEHIGGNRLVITGGGSQIIGISDLARRVMDKQTRSARPIGIEGLADALSGPAFATAIGMLHYEMMRRNRERWMSQESPGFWKQLIRWIRAGF